MWNNLSIPSYPLLIFPVSFSIFHFNLTVFVYWWCHTSQKLLNVDLHQEVLWASFYTILYTYENGNNKTYFRVYFCNLQILLIHNSGRSHSSHNFNDFCFNYQIPDPPAPWWNSGTQSATVQREQIGKWPITWEDPPLSMPSIKGQIPEPLSQIHQLFLPTRRRVSCK